MSFYPLTIPLADKTTGVPITTFTQLNMRLTSNLGSSAYTMISSSGGNYVFGTVGSPIVAGEYVLYEDETALDFGIISIGQSDAVLTSGNQTINGVKTFSGQPILNAGVQTDTISEKTATNGVSIDGVVLKDGNLGKASDPVEIAYITQIGNNLSVAGYDIANAVDPVGDTSLARRKYITDNFMPYGTADSYSYKSMFNSILFRNDPPKSNATVYASNALVNRRYVDNSISTAVEGITSGDITAAQLCDNTVFVMPTGTQETDRIYPGIDGAYASAVATANATNTMFIIMLANDLDGSATANYDLFTTTAIDEFVNIGGISKDVVMRITDDTYVGVSSTNKNIFSNITINCTGTTVSPTMENCIFDNVRFDTSGNDGTTWNFAKCHFGAGCEITDNVGGFTFDSDTTGVVFDVTNNKFIYVNTDLTTSDDTDQYDIITNNGDVKPKRLLGRQGSDITADASIAFGQGNYFVINGGTTIATISTSGWTDGSIVSCYFSGTPLIDTGAGNIAHTGGDVTPAAGQVIQFILDSASWIIID